MKNIFVLCFVLFFNLKSFAQNSNDGLTVVAVGEATLEKDKLIFQDAFINTSLSNVQRNAVDEFVKLLRNDFSFYQKKFFVVEAGANTTSYRPAVNYDFWAAKNVRYLGSVSAERAGDQLKFSVIVEDVKQRKQIFNQVAVTALPSLRRTGHDIANEIYKQIVGKDSIFKSKIIFVSDRNSRGSKTVKEVYLMDFDGKNVNQLTSHGGIVISPALSKDGTKLIYSLISNSSQKRNHNLYLMDLKTKEAKIISEREGINSGAIFLDGDKSIALTLTVSGNAEIYEMSLETRSLRKITNHFSSDVDPSTTADNKLMTFLSDRSGRAMIYTLDASGEEKNVKRISFVGQFNATPRFSPDGREIVFSSWLDNNFDLFKINSDGSGLARLTKDFGSNESPTYSNDGEFISFSSQRVLSKVKIDQNIYIMDRDGAILGAITQGFGNCTSPRWYNY